MKKASALILPTLFTLGIMSAANAQPAIVPPETAPADAVPEIMAQEEEPNLEVAGWDPVKAANIMGAADWCMTSPEVSEADQTTYRLLSEGAARALATYMATGDITATEASIISGRVSDQGYYMGLELTAAECNTLKNIVVNWAPWQLITSRDAGFAIEMPNLPSREVTTATIQGRDFEWVLYDAIAAPESNPLLADEEYYLVGYAQLPQDYLASNSEAAIFDAFGQNILDRMGLPNLEDSTREVTTDGVPSRVTIGEAYDQSVAMVTYIVDDRFYLNLMVGQEPLRFERFFRSFEALDFVEPAAMAHASVTGTVAYRARIGLPPGSVVKVSLLDISQSDTPAAIVAEQTIVTTGEQVPIPFELPYAPSDIDPSGRYTVSAQILVEDEPHWHTASEYPVITQGATSSVAIVVEPAAAE